MICPKFKNLRELFAYGEFCPFCQKQRKFSMSAYVDNNDEIISLSNLKKDEDKVVFNIDFKDFSVIKCSLPLDGNFIIISSCSESMLALKYYLSLYFSCQTKMKRSTLSCSFVSFEDLSLDLKSYSIGEILLEEEAFILESNDAEYDIFLDYKNNQFTINGFNGQIANKHTNHMSLPLSDIDWDLYNKSELISKIENLVFFS